jgi:cytochrome c oxidase assembly protein subunit 11
LSNHSKNTNLALSLAALVAGMVMLSYAAVPLYDLFCRVTGFDGTTVKREYDAEFVSDRIVKVQFNADTNQGLSWEFAPTEREIPVQIGEQRLTFYTAKNLKDELIKGVATYNVTPHKTAKYFGKIECFCFVEQTLEANQEVEMPVSFFIDPTFLDDPDMDDVSVITLSYTFFLVKE